MSMDRIGEYAGAFMLLHVFSLYEGSSANFVSTITAQKMKFSVKDFLSKCDQNLRKLRIWSHLLKKSLMENLIFCAVY